MNKIKKMYITLMAVVLCGTCLIAPPSFADDIENGNEGITTVVQTTIAPKPAEIKVKAKVTGFYRIKVSWSTENLSNAKYYKVFKSLKKNKEFKSTGGYIKKKALTIKKLKWNKKYYFKVKAYDKNKKALATSKVISKNTKSLKMEDLSVIYWCAEQFDPDFAGPCTGAIKYKQVPGASNYEIWFKIIDDDVTKSKHIKDMSLMLNLYKTEKWYKIVNATNLVPKHYYATDELVPFDLGIKYTKKQYKIAKKFVKNYFTKEYCKYNECSPPTSSLIADIAKDHLRESIPSTAFPYFYTTSNKDYAFIMVPKPYEKALSVAYKMRAYKKVGKKKIYSGFSSCVKYLAIYENKDKITYKKITVPYTKWEDVMKDYKLKTMDYYICNNDEKTYYLQRTYYSLKNGELYFTPESGSTSNCYKDFLHQGYDGWGGIIY